MKPTLINIAKRTQNTEYYDRSRDIETALAWHSTKKILIESKREELFGYITSIRLSEKNIVITTGKPIVNTELKEYIESILKNFNETIPSLGGRKREKIRTQ
jgi:hypothetical protein